MSSKGQLTIPKALRDCLALRAGSMLQISLDQSGHLVLIPTQFAPEQLFDDRPDVDRVLSVADMDGVIAGGISDRT